MRGRLYAQSVWLKGKQKKEKERRARILNDVGKSKSAVSAIPSALLLRSSHSLPPSASCPPSLFLWGVPTTLAALAFWMDEKVKLNIEGGSSFSTR